MTAFCIMMIMMAPAAMVLSTDIYCPTQGVHALHASSQHSKRATKRSVIWFAQWVLKVYVSHSD